MSMLSMPLWPSRYAIVGEWPNGSIAQPLTGRTPTAIRCDRYIQTAGEVRISSNELLLLVKIVTRMK